MNFSILNNTNHLIITINSFHKIGLVLPILNFIPNLSFGTKMSNFPKESESDSKLETCTEEIIGMTYSWKLEDNFKNRGQLEIHAWAFGRDSKPILFRICDFPVMCYIALPMFSDNRIIHWSEGEANQVGDHLKSILGENAPTKFMFRPRKKLYYYRGNEEQPMLK